MGLEVEGCFLSAQSFQEYKSDHISPLLKNIPWPSIAYREMATFPAAVQAVYQVTNPQVFSACFLHLPGAPHSCGGRGVPQADGKMGGAF